jgi:hypothetical protein
MGAAAGGLLAGLVSTRAAFVAAGAVGMLMAISALATQPKARPAAV